MGIKIISNFKSGNLCNVEIEKNDNFDIIKFAPSPKGGPESLWFYFKVIHNGRKKIKIILKHFYNTLGAKFPPLIRPVIKKDGEWQRLPEPEIEMFPDGRYSIFWIISPPLRNFEIAFCYPYGIEELEKLIKESEGYWKKDIIGISMNNRPLIRLSNNYGNKKLSGIYLIARQHSGETPGSWVLDGFLRYFAKIKTDKILVWAIPLSNIDGIEEGYYGKDNFPYDLYNAWGTPPMRHEILVFQRDIYRWIERCKPILGIDFHAPGGCETEGIYFNLKNRDKKTIEWIEKISSEVDKKYISDEYKKFSIWKERWQTPTFSEFFINILKIPGILIEIPYTYSKNHILEINDYLRIGEEIAKGIIKNI